LKAGIFMTPDAFTNDDASVNPEAAGGAVRHAVAGDTVTVHYRVSTLDGQTVGMSPDDEPLTLVLGEGVFLPGFEAGIEGMAAGEIRDFVIQPEEAFGPVVEEMIQEVGIEAFGPDAHVEVGQTYTFDDPSGMTEGRLFLRVVAVDGDRVVLDANHPLAGEPLRCQIKLLSISGTAGDSPA